MLVIVFSSLMLISCGEVSPQDSSILNKNFKNQKQVQLVQVRKNPEGVRKDRDKRVKKVVISKEEKIN